jgi:two-component system OmpR family sensor kinase
MTGHGGERMQGPPGHPWVAPLAVRLVAISALVTAAALLVVTALAVQRTRAHLERGLEERLVAAAASFREGPGRSARAPEELSDAIRRWLAGRAQGAGEFVAVRLVTGEILTTGSGLDLRDVPSGGELLESTERRWWTRPGPDGEVRALTVPLRLAGRPVGTLVAGESAAPIDQAASDLVARIVWASGGGLLLAVALAAIAVRRTLRPLGRMSADIRTIQATGDLSRRVADDGPADEVGRLAEAFNEALTRLEAAFTSQRQFVADASHELRTPLTVARGQLELVASEERDPKTRRSLGIALEELDRMARIVNDLLLLARLDEGLSLASEPLELELAVREALLRSLPADGARVTVDVQSGLCARGDSHRLQQVLTNLVGNAVRHGGPGVHVTVNGRGEGHRVVLEVADDGPGIPPEHIPHVFERFYRGAAARAGGSGSAGLGLAIVRSLTEGMGGSVSVRSNPGQGTQFTLTLPAEEVDARTATADDVLRQNPRHRSAHLRE